MIHRGNNPMEADPVVYESRKKGAPHGSDSANIGGGGRARVTEDLVCQSHTPNISDLVGLCIYIFSWVGSSLFCCVEHACGLGRFPLSRLGVGQDRGPLRHGQRMATGHVGRRGVPRLDRIGVSCLLDLPHKSLAEEVCLVSKVGQRLHVGGGVLISGFAD